MCRVILITHVCGMFFELGIAIVTLLGLLSGMRSPESAASAAKRSNELGITIASMISTTAAFCLTMIGTGDAMAGLQTIAARVGAALSRTRGARFSTKSGHCTRPVNEDEERPVFVDESLLQNAV